MTVTDFSLMAVLVIVITVGLIRATGAKDYFERGILTIAGVAFTIFAMAIISTCFREEVNLLELEKTRIRKLIEDGEIAEAGSRLNEHLIGTATYPGLLKYISQAAELSPLLDFWEELRVIRGGLL